MSDSSSSSGMSSGLMTNLTQECLTQVRELLKCHLHRTEDNDSRPICEPRNIADSENTGATHAVFLSVVIVTVVLTLVLNLAVLVTIAVNKKLHTLINYLVSLMCANQLIWIIFPMNEIFTDPHTSEIFCKIRVFTIRFTSAVTSGLMVTITLLRYLMVVRNHRYPAAKRNILMFTMLAGVPFVLRTLIPFVLRTLTLSYEDYGRCAPVVAWTPNDYTIKTMPTRVKSLKRIIVFALEHIIGFAIILFCSAKILSKARASKKRLRGHAIGRITQRQQNYPAPDPVTANRNPCRLPAAVTREPEPRPTRQTLHLQSETSQHSVRNQTSTRQTPDHHQPSGSRQSLSDQSSTSQETVIVTAMSSHPSKNIVPIPNTERSTEAVKQHRLTVPSASANHPSRRRMSAHAAIAWPDSPESDPGGQVTDRQIEPAGEVILSAATSTVLRLSGTVAIFFDVRMRRRRRCWHTASSRRRRLRLCSGGRGTGAAPSRRRRLRLCSGGRGTGAAPSRRRRLRFCSGGRGTGAGPLHHSPRSRD